MNARQAKKHAARFSARVLSLPLTLAHARPSFYQQNVGYQRLLLRDRMTKGLGVARDIANYVTRRCWPPVLDASTPESATGAHPE